MDQMDPQKEHKPEPEDLSEDFSIETPPLSCNYMYSGIAS